MQSIILVAKNAEKKDAYITSFCEKEHISKFDQTVINTDDSVGIELVRIMQKSIHLKPFQGEKKIVIIANAQTLTIQAQNALLKILEEPPLSTYIFLLTTTLENFLPTILSRCNIISLEEEKKEFDKKQLLTEFLALKHAPIGEKLQKAEKLAEKKEALSVWFEEMILSLRNEMLACTKKKDIDEISSVDFAHAINKYQKAYQILKQTNVNPRFLLENLFLSL
ncbi:MAG: hypothetical protein ACREGI_00575 [Candidatus Levyibacteriota bacterium]